MTPQALADRMAAAAQEFKPATELLRAVGRVLRVSIKSEIRKRAYDTGKMHASVRERVLPESVSVGPNTTYDQFVNDGTRYMEGRHFMEHGEAAAMPDISKELETWGNMVLGRVAGR